MLDHARKCSPVWHPLRGHPYDLEALQPPLLGASVSRALAGEIARVDCNICILHQRRRRLECRGSDCRIASLRASACAFVAAISRWLYSFQVSDEDLAGALDDDAEDSLHTINGGFDQALRMGWLASEKLF